MRILKLAIVFVAAVFGGIASAFGATTLQVDRLLDTATYSIPARTHTVGWNVTITNSGTGPSSPVVFLGRTRVLDTAEKAKFDDYYFSAPNADPRCRGSNLFPAAVSCVIPGLYPGQVFKFTVSYKAPIKVVNGVADDEVPAPSDYVNFRGTTIAAEDRDIYVDRDPSNRVALRSESDTQVATVCPPTGCTVYTGTNDGIPTTTDLYTTKVTVPGGTQPTTIGILETSTGSQTSPCNANVLLCWTSQLTIPSNSNGAAFDPPLTIVLREDTSNVRTRCAHEDDDEHDSLVHVASVGGANSNCSPATVSINDIFVVYVPDGQTAESPVGVCTGAGSTLGAGQHECVAERLYVVDGLLNYYQFKVLSDHNGGWGIR